MGVVALYLPIGALKYTQPKRFDHFGLYSIITIKIMYLIIEGKNTGI